MASQEKDKNEQQEEDVPESFFDDFMNEEFMEGLNVVDTWEGDDTTKPSSSNTAADKTTTDPKVTESSNRKDEIKSSNRKDEIKSSAPADDKSKNLNDKSKDPKDKNDAKKCSRKKKKCSKSQEYKPNELNARRDPNKTQRDILKDKDKCEKDKTTKMIYEKLKVVETGLIPPGMEMEVDVQKNNTSKLEEGELTDQDPTPVKKPKSKSIENRKEYKPIRSEVRRSRSRGRRHSPVIFRRSRSRSLVRRFRSRSRSLDRRIERRRRSRSFSAGRRYRERYRSPLRKTSPLAKRNQNLFKEIDELKAKLFSDSRKSPVPHRNVESEMMQRPHVGQMPQNFNNNMQYPQPAPCPVPNPHFMQLQPTPVPVPPPQQMELDQQFFIGQPSMVMDHNPFGMPMQQPQPPLQMMPNPMMQPVGPPMVPMQPNFQPNWGQPPQMMPEFFNNQQNLANNPGLMSLGEHLGFNNQMNMPPNEQQQIPFFPQQPQPQPANPMLPPATFSKKENEEEVFAKLFTDKKITLSDYLSVTAKSTDPVDIQKKIKVITLCQDAIGEMNGRARTSGRFILRKSQKPPIKIPDGEGLSPFKKVPAIKFQFTTFTKNTDDKSSVGHILNKLLLKLGVGVAAQCEDSPGVVAKNDQKESQTKTVPPEKEKITITSQSSYTQTETVKMVDFGCQVSFEDVAPSPTKSISKKESLAKLTPAQLLARSGRDATPPPAPKWTPSPIDVSKRREKADSFRNFNDDDMDRRSRNMASPRPMPERYPMPLFPSYYDRSPERYYPPYFGYRY